MTPSLALGGVASPWYKALVSACAFVFSHGKIRRKLVVIIAITQ